MSAKINGLTSHTTILFMLIPVSVILWDLIPVACAHLNIQKHYDWLACQTIHLLECTSGLGNFMEKKQITYTKGIRKGVYIHPSNDKWKNYMLKVCYLREISFVMVW